jgi:tetratricopeptide (TPR) repeat protein
VATYLEQSWGAEEEEIVEVVASHYLQAHDLDPQADDAQAIRGKAMDMLARAGERAASLAASGEARRYFEQASSLADDPLVKADLLDRAGRMAWMGGDAEGSTHLFEESIALYESQGQAQDAARVSGGLADVESAAGRLSQAIERLERAFEIVSQETASKDLADLAARLGAAYIFAGQPAKAREPVELALKVSESLWLPDVLSRALRYKSILSLFDSRPEETFALTSHALKVALDHDLPAPATMAYFNLSDLMFRRDRYLDALEYLQEALALARRMGDRLHEWELMGETTYPLYMLGRWDEAVATFAEIPQEQIRSAGLIVSPLTSVLEIYTHRGSPEEAEALLSLYARMEGSADIQERSSLVGAKAALHLGMKQYREALSFGLEAFEMRQSLGIASQAVKQGFTAACEAAFGLGDHDRVDALIKLIEDLPPGERPPLLAAQARRFRARVEATRGKGQEAIGPFKSAAGLFRELGTPFWLGVTLLEHAEYLARQGRADEAAPLRDEARTIFEGLEAEPWIARLEQEAKQPATL